MRKFREFFVDVFMRWDPIMSGVLLAFLLAVITFFYEKRHGTGTLPWCVYVFVALVFVFYACYGAWWDKDQSLQEAQQQLDTRARHREQRETLARFIEKGLQVRQTYETLEPVPKNAARQWQTEVCLYLAQNLGHDYTIRFQRPTGPRRIALHERPPDISEENYVFYLYFNMRLERLEGLIKELRD
jgi:hypothetical protein